MLKKTFNSFASQNTCGCSKAAPPHPTDELCGSGQRSLIDHHLQQQQEESMSEQCLIVWFTVDTQIMAHLKFSDMSDDVDQLMDLSSCHDCEAGHVWITWKHFQFKSRTTFSTLFCLCFNQLINKLALRRHRCKSSWAIFIVTSCTMKTASPCVA